MKYGVAAFLILFPNINSCRAYETRASQAGVIRSSIPGSMIDFNDMKSARYGSVNQAGDFANSGISFSGDGIIMKNGVDGSAPALGLYAEPFHDHTNYLAIVGGGTETLHFDKLEGTFGLYWGSMDAYNYITFFRGSQEVASFVGSELLGIDLIPNGGQQSDDSNRYIEFLGLSPFDTVLLGSGGNSFEVDNVMASPADGAPAPLAGAGLLSFFGAGGLAMRRRARRSISSLLPRWMAAA